MAVLGDLLFFSGRQEPSLDDKLRHNLQIGLPRAVERLPQADFRAKTDDQLASEVAASCSVSGLALKLDKSKGDARPVRFEHQNNWGERAHISGLRITKEVPFEGDVALWKLRPSNWDTNPPRGEIVGSAVVIGMEVPESEGEQAVQHIERTLQQIAVYIEWQSKQIADHNAALPQAAATAIAQRRATFAKADDIAKRLSGG